MTAEHATTFCLACFWDQERQQFHGAVIVQLDPKYYGPDRWRILYGDDEPSEILHGNPRICGCGLEDR